MYGEMVVGELFFVVVVCFLLLFCFWLDLFVISLIAFYVVQVLLSSSKNLSK